MDLFRVDRYMGDDEDEENNRDETSRFLQLQREIEDRKGKRQSLQHENPPNLGMHGSGSVGDVISSQSSKESSNLKKMQVRKRKKTSTVELQTEELEEKIPKRSSKSSFSEKNENGDHVKEATKSHRVEDNLGQEHCAQKKGKKKKEKVKDEKDTEEHEKQHDKEEAGIDTASSKSESTGFTVIRGQRKDKEVKKVQRILPDWLAKPNIINTDLRSNLVPVEEMSCLDTYLVRSLQQHNIYHLFPVQSAIIPAVLSQMDANSCFGKGGYQLSDVCVSAPTGSGKTLAYVLPIVQSLMKRVVCHLRALILLPTKDLATQVKQVFEMFTEETNLRVGLTSGSTSFTKDEEQLTDNSSSGSTSYVDILVCTPGRLVDHISSTPHFTLQHVRFLVIDEADRLLDQSYHGWLTKVLKAAYNKHSFTSNFTQDGRPFSCDLQTLRSPPGNPTPSTFSAVQLPFQKLLFSATMTHSPEKLAPLQLYRPLLFAATGTAHQTGENEVSTTDVLSSGRYTIPESLAEYMTVCNSGEKPLIVLYFLIQLKFERVLCFASSLEATHRLFLLVKLFGGVTVAEYSSSLTPQQRTGILRDFKLGKIRLLICSDAMARGMDIQGVQYVISYDVPNYIRSYIHRVGRTARAGTEGTAITLLQSNEVHHFKELIRKIGREKIAKYNVKEDKLLSMVDKYQETLEKLQEAVQEESRRKPRQKLRTEYVTKFLQEQITSNLLQKIT